MGSGMRSLFFAKGGSIPQPHPAASKRLFGAYQGASTVHPRSDPMKTRFAVAAAATLAVCLLAGCASSPMMSSFKQDTLPEAVKVPAGHQVFWETVGVGDITYECRAKANATGEFEWVFAGPKAALNDRNGKTVGAYFGPPATWRALDGSSLTGTQVAVAPAGAGNIPLQLVKANPASGPGAVNGTAYIQRVATKGGVAPATACAAGNMGQRQIVSYQADYIFWKAM
jgi:hypothetical protein